MNKVRQDISHVMQSCFYELEESLRQISQGDNLQDGDFAVICKTISDLKYQFEYAAKYHIGNDDFKLV